MRKNAKYTTYKGKDFRVAVPTDKTVDLCSENPEDIKDGFEQISENIFVKTVSREEIGKVFSVRNYCLYKGYEFTVGEIHGEDIFILTWDDKLYESKQFNLEVRDRGIYQMRVRIDELDKAWEVIEEIKDF